MKGVDGHVQPTKLPDGLRLADDRGAFTFSSPAPHIELMRCEGYAQASHVDFVLSNRERILSRCGRIAIFDDLEKLQGYDSDVRIRLSKWAREHRSQIVTFHILTRSKVVAMGVTVANLALGGRICAHAIRSAFDAELALEIRRGGKRGERMPSSGSGP